MNTKQLDAVGDIVGLMLAEALTPIRRELLALGERVAALPDVAAAVKAAVDALPAPAAGKDGTSVTIEQVQPLVAEAVAKAVDALPAPAAGKDGTSVTIEQVQPLVAEAVAKAVDALPAPAAGKDGTSVTIEQVQPLVAEAVAKAVDALPAPAAGKDGAGLAGAMIDRDGNLQVTMTDGTVKDLGPVVGKSLDAFAMEYLPETHEVRIKAACAGREQEVRFDAGGIRLAQASNGYWCEGVKAKALEAFSYDGCLWVARSATTAKPSVESPDWVLAARQGRIGPAGKDFNAPRAPETIKVGGAK
jgi:hypothetical protein